MAVLFCGYCKYVVNPCGKLYQKNVHVALYGKAVPLLNAVSLLALFYRYAVYHRSLHKLRSSSRVTKQSATAALDQERRGSYVRFELLIF